MEPMEVRRTSKTFSAQYYQQQQRQQLYGKSAPESPVGGTSSSGSVSSDNNISHNHRDEPHRHNTMQPSWSSPRSPRASSPRSPTWSSPKSPDARRQPLPHVPVENTNLHYRTNFSRGYVPPVPTPVTPTRVSNPPTPSPFTPTRLSNPPTPSPFTPTRLSNPPTPKRQSGTWTEEDVPFDQQFQPQAQSQKHYPTVVYNRPVGLVRDKVVEATSISNKSSDRVVVSSKGPNKPFDEEDDEIMKPVVTSVQRHSGIRAVNNSNGLGNDWRTTHNSSGPNLDRNSNTPSFERMPAYTPKSPTMHRTVPFVPNKSTTDSVTTNKAIRLTTDRSTTAYNSNAPKTDRTTSYLPNGSTSDSKTINNNAIGPTINRTTKSYTSNATPTNGRTTHNVVGSNTDWMTNNVKGTTTVRKTAYSSNLPASDRTTSHPPNGHTSDSMTTNDVAIEPTIDRTTKAHNSNATSSDGTTANDAVGPNTGRTTSNVMETSSDRMTASSLNAPASDGTTVYTAPNTETMINNSIRSSSDPTMLDNSHALASDRTTAYYSMEVNADDSIGRATDRTTAEKSNERVSDRTTAYDSIGGDLIGDRMTSNSIGPKSHRITPNKTVRHKSDRRTSDDTDGPTLTRRIAYREDELSGERQTKTFSDEPVVERRTNYNSSGPASDSKMVYSSDGPTLVRRLAYRNDEPGSLRQAGYYSEEGIRRMDTQKHATYYDDTFGSQATAGLIAVRSREDTAVTSQEAALLPTDPTSSDDAFDQEDQNWNETETSEMDYHSSAGEEFVVTSPRRDARQYEVSDMSTGSTTDGSTRPVQPESILKTRAARSSEDDDSIFDFGEQKMITRMTPLKTGSTSNPRRGRRPMNADNDDDDADDASLDHDYGVVRKRSSSLQVRTQQAWASRKVAQRSHSNPSKKLSSEPGVGFDNSNNGAIHHIQQDVGDEETLATAATGRSLNSVYTKSMDSEVEDVIKDLFFIGSGVTSNPGRRKLKYQPEHKRILQGADGDDDTSVANDDLTLNTLDEDVEELTNFTRETYSTLEGEDVSIETKRIDAGNTTRSPPRKPNSDMRRKEPSVEKVVSPKHEQQSKDDEDPLVAVWGYVEGGMSVMSSALGLNETPPKSEGIKVRSTDTTKPVGKLDPSEIEEKGPFDEMIEYSSCLCFDGSLCDTGDSAQELQKFEESSPRRDTTTVVAPLEQDPRLEELALIAVHTKHEMHGVQFDETYNIDIVTDITFSVVILALPLGILFHENEGGCWVTKLFPNGNAAKRGGVEEGDQLAAINGASAIHMRVDQICDLISKVPDSNEVELTFLRYDGPLHPLHRQTPVKQEVYNFIDQGSDKRKAERKFSLRKEGKTATRVSAADTSKAAALQTAQAKTEPTVETEQSKPSKRFKWFGRGKKNQSK